MDWNDAIGLLAKDPLLRIAGAFWLGAHGLSATADALMTFLN